MHNYLSYMSEQIILLICFIVIGFHLYPVFHKIRIGPPVYKLNDKVFVPDYMDKDGKDLVCRVVHIETFCNKYGELQHFYVLIPFNSSEMIVIQEDLILKCA